MENQETWLPALEKNDLLNLNDMQGVWNSISSIDLSYDQICHDQILLKCFDCDGKIVYFESFDERDAVVAFQMANTLSYINGLEVNIFQNPTSISKENKVEVKKKSFIKRLFGK